MPLATNAVMTFTGYTIETTGGVTLRFVCSDPGGGEPSDYDCLLTDAELNGAANLAALRTVVINKLNRRYRATGLKTKLDLLVGQSVTIP